MIYKLKDPKLRAKLIESQNFERGMDPKESMNIGIPEAKIIQLERIKEILSKHKDGGLFCLWDWESDIESMEYYTDVDLLLKNYSFLAIETAKDFNNQIYDIRKILIVYKIDIKEKSIQRFPAKFVYERDPIGHNGIRVLFGIEFMREKIYHH